MKKLTLSSVDSIELNRLSAMVKSCKQQIIAIENKALTEGVRLKELHKDTRLVPIRKLLVRFNNSSVKILQRSYL